MAADRFARPSEVKGPSGAEGWEDLYNWYHVFRPERAVEDEGRFWFHDRLHHPDPLYPYDEIHSEAWWHGLGAFNTRIFAMPPAYGVDQRILNGYLYVSPVPVEDPEEVGRRAELYRRRAGHYYEHWDEIYEEWKAKVVERFEELKALRFDPLPGIEDERLVLEHRGVSSGFELLSRYQRLLLLILEAMQYHFEMLNVGYAAYLTFFDFCKRAFPGITDQSISRMLGGLRVDLYRSDDELKRLAREAERLGVGDLLLAAGPGDFEEALEGAPGGREWLADWRATADPWFRMATDTGHPGGYHTSPTWMDEPAIPLGFVREYVGRLRRGEDLERPTAAVLEERDRLSDGYRTLLHEDDRVGFDELLALARKVFVFIEEHVLYIEHWMYSTFWAKSKELARAMTAMGCFDDPEDLFYLRRTEVGEVLYDAVVRWAVGTGGDSRQHWRPIIARRRAVHRTLSAWTPPPALGEPPESVEEPFTLLLWGITTDTIRNWLSGGDGDEGVLRGVAGSPGVAEGPARVVHHVSQLAEVRQGEVLVCSATSPAWSPVFSRIAATISDVGGIMSHTAIVCREYRLPAVVGTGHAVTTIVTGQRVRVDGDLGVVTILP